jgi:hypothetical protein
MAVEQPARAVNDLVSYFDAVTGGIGHGILISAESKNASRQRLHSRNILSYLEHILASCFHARNTVSETIGRATND